MGEAKTGVNEDTRHHTHQLESEIASLRGEISDAVAELDRRRREAMDVKLQLSRHAFPLVLAACGVGALLTGGLALAALRRQRNQRVTVRAKRVRKAMGRAMDHPERVAQGEPHLGMKILTAALTALAGATAKRMAERAVAPRKTIVIPERVIPERVLPASQPTV